LETGVDADAAAAGAGACVAAAGGGLGKYSGPRWPQALSRASTAVASEIVSRRDKSKRGFTIRISSYSNLLECSMTESEFMALADATLNAIETALEQAAQDNDLDIECNRSGNLLDIEFADNGSKIIVNSQAPLQEIWVAAKSGGFHYKRVGQQWVNTRDGSELFASLSGFASAQAASPLVLKERG
jgi:CyaY protein